MNNLLRESLLKPDGIAVSFTFGDYLRQQMFIECFFCLQSKIDFDNAVLNFMFLNILKHKEILVNLEDNEAYVQICIKIRISLCSVLLRRRRR